MQVADGIMQIPEYFYTGPRMVLCRYKISKQKNILRKMENFEKRGKTMKLEFSEWILNIGHMDKFIPDTQLVEQTRYKWSVGIVRQIWSVGGA